VKWPPSVSLPCLRICQDEEVLCDSPVLARLVKRSPNELLCGTLRDVYNLQCNASIPTISRHYTQDDAYSVQSGTSMAVGHAAAGSTHVSSTRGIHVAKWLGRCHDLWKSRSGRAGFLRAVAI